MNLASTVINNNVSLPLKSTIVQDDKVLIQEAVRRWRPDSKNYEDSWGYVLQSTRYDGFKWYDPDNGSLILFGRKTKNDPTLVVTNFFATYSYLAHVIKIVQDAYQAPQTILKNVNSKDVSSLVPHGFRPYKKSEFWNKNYRFDDQTYPQLIVELQNINELKGREYRLIRKTLRKDLQTHIRPYRDSDKDEVLAIFSAIDGTTDKSLLEQAKGTYYESHAMFPSADLDKFVIVTNTTDAIIGFNTFSAITTETTASVACLFKPGAGVISVWGLYQSLMAMYQKGFQRVNFGGSETEGSYNFIREKFRPKEEIEKTHLVFNT